MATKSDGNRSLKRFAEYAVAMRNILYQDRALSEAEYLFMDNHFRVMEMAYLRWKEKHRPDILGTRNEVPESKMA
jgi:hypothetical protein